MLTSSVTEFFHLAHCPQVHLCCSIRQYFVPFYCQIIFHCMAIFHFVHPLISWWPLRLFLHFLIMLRWTFWYKFLCGHRFSLLLSIYLWVEFLSLMVLIFISLMTNDVEHLFLWLLATYMWSLENCLFKFFAHF